jgi:hypothetical protein
VKIVIALPLFTALLLGGCGKHEISKELATNIAANQASKAITSSQPLEIPEGWIGEILVAAPNEYQRDYHTEPFTLVSPMGKAVHVQVNFREINGHTSSTEITSFWGPDLVFHIPPTAKIHEIEITSTQPLSPLSVTWHVYDPREVKR